MLLKLKNAIEGTYLPPGVQIIYMLGRPMVTEKIGATESYVMLELHIFPPELVDPLEYAFEMDKALAELAKVRAALNTQI